MKILHKNSLKQGGFAGLIEHRLVTDSRLFGSYKSNDTWNGLGNFVYLADANFLPNGQTNMHPHKEVDVISVMVDGRIKHEGSLQDGQLIDSHQIQVQRAGGEGFSHNEINPDNKKNRMIQLWVLPEIKNQKAGYKLYAQKTGELIHVYGGSTNQNITFDNHTNIKIGTIIKGEIIKFTGEFIAYFTKGEGILNGIKVKNGDLVRDSSFNFQSTQDTQLILIYEKQDY